MEISERIEKLKKPEKEILSDIYWVILYIAMALFILFIISIRFNNPIITMVILIIAVIIYTLGLIYLIGLAVTFGTVRAKRVLLKAEIGGIEG